MIDIIDEVEKKTVATGNGMLQGQHPNQIEVTQCVNQPGHALKVGGHYNLKDTGTGHKTAVKCLHVPGAGMQIGTFERV